MLTIHGVGIDFRNVFDKYKPSFPQRIWGAYCFLSLDYFSYKANDYLLLVTNVN